MKTWILVWILAFQPNDSGQYEFEYHVEEDLTFEECVKLLAQEDVDLPERENYAGHSIYCKENAPRKVLQQMNRTDI